MHFEAAALPVPDLDYKVLDVQCPSAYGRVSVETARAFDSNWGKVIIPGPLEYIVRDALGAVPGA